MNTDPLTRLGIAALALLALSIGACGGDDDSGMTATGDGTEDTGAVEAPTDDGADTSTPTGEGQPDCPFSADEVSEVLGAAVEQMPGLCGFGPDGDIIGSPSLLYVLQVVNLCSADLAAEVGYPDELDTLGVEAYVGMGGEATAKVLVCDDSPFEVLVNDRDDSAAALAAAEELAQIALDA